MSYRDKLTLGSVGGQRGIFLQCNKSEKKSVVRRYSPDGSLQWMSEKVQSRHTDGTPKHLHIPILEEGIYEVLGQPKLSGFYALYLNGKGYMSYCPLDRKAATAVLAKIGSDGLRAALVAVGKSVY